MAIKRTLWICPRCNELNPTRHQSVVRHIDRKHRSLGEPISVTTRETRNQMLASGSLAPIKKPFLRKSTSSQGFYNNYSSTTISDQKNEQGKSSMGSSDVFDRWITYGQLNYAKDTNQKVQTILNQNSTIIATLAEVMKEIRGLKRSRTNNFVGEFS